MKSHPHQQRISECIRKRRFEDYLMWHGGHERDAAFFRIIPLLNDREYWKCLREAWWNLETSITHKRKWIRCYRSPRESRDSLMTAAERRALDALPGRFPVFRGIGSPQAANGLSWTLSKKVAERFAAYSVGPRRQSFGLGASAPMIVYGWCKKADVLALYLDRKEKEIVVPASLVSGKLIEPLCLPTSRAESRRRT